jgi:hypothetical protein
VLPGLQEAAAARFDMVMEASLEGEKSEDDVSKMLATGQELNGRPYRIRTCDTLIKSQVLCQLS